MVDPIAAIAASASKSVDETAAEAAKTGGKLLLNLLGPVTEEMGKDLLVRYKNKNVRRVVELADVKRRGREGSIPPRVAGTVFEAASFADDEFVAEYLSGVLASSISEDGTDDRGVTWTSLVARMSSDQLKVHFSTYAAYRRLMKGTNETDFVDHQNDDLLIGWDDLEAATGLSGNRLVEAWHGLINEDLVSHQMHGEAEFLARNIHPRKVLPAEFPGGAVFHATPRGIALFMQGNGIANAWIDVIAQVDLDLLSPPTEDIDHARLIRVSDLPPVHESGGAS